MTDSNRQPRTESNRQRDERSGQDELGGYRTAMDVQETTMDQGQQAIRQTAELQRSFAQAALRGIESQQAAQRQAFEFTKAAIGSYVDTMNSMLPALEDAQQQFTQEAASAGAEMTDQFQQTTREMNQQSEQFGQQIAKQGRQPGQRIEQQPGQQIGQRTGHQSGGTGQPQSGGIQQPDAPHERGIRPQASGQRGGGSQPPQQSDAQPRGTQQPPQTAPSQPGSAEHERGQPRTRPPGTTGQSSESNQRSDDSTDSYRTGRGQSESRGRDHRDEPSNRSGGRTSPTHQQRREPPRTSPPGEETSQREIPISSSPERTHGPSRESSTEYGNQSDASGGSRDTREEPPE